MRAILVSVDFNDLLSITLPYNRKHFSDVMVVTDTKNERPVREICERNNACMYVTDSFYSEGAKFNKWKALEEGLDKFGRSGWIALMDVDILWPRELKVECTTKGTPSVYYSYKGTICTQEVNQLCSPLRRMMLDIPIPFSSGNIPSENTWSRFKLHRNVLEWAGYSQILNCADPYLPKGYWHQTKFIHAGCSDSFFQNLWPVERKIRPNFEVLHLGEPGMNWMGRASDYLDGTKNPLGESRKNEILSMWRERRRLEALRRSDKRIDQYYPERIHNEDKFKGSL